MKNIAAFLGRLFIGILLLQAILFLIQWQDYLGTMAESEGIPVAPLLIKLAIGVSLVCIAMLIFGFRTKTGAWVMIILALPVLLLYFSDTSFEGVARGIWGVHEWASTSAMSDSRSFSFWQLLAVIGGLLMIVANGPGKISVDGFLGKTKK